jgi:hypothetical protein
VDAGTLAAIFAAIFACTFDPSARPFDQTPAGDPL